MSIKYFRAIPSNKFDEIQNTVYKRQNSKRIPSNIPYYIDNIWEFLRPEKMPSRRHAVYASPTPELALDNASSYTKNGFIVTQLQFNNQKYKTAQIQVADARFHRDLKELKEVVFDYLGKEFSDLSISAKMQHFPLFLPSVGREELQPYFDREKRLLDNLQQASSFWQTASNIIEDHDGELFFELLDGCSYTLMPIK